MFLSKVKVQEIQCYNDRKKNTGIKFVINEKQCTVSFIRRSVVCIFSSFTEQKALNFSLSLEIGSISSQRKGTRIGWGKVREKKNEGEIETQNRLKVGFVIFFRSVFDEKNCGS